MFTEEQGFQKAFSYLPGEGLITELCLLVIPVLKYHVLSENYADLQAKLELPHSPVKFQLHFLGVSLHPKNDYAKMSLLAIPVVCLGLCLFLTTLFHPRSEHFRYLHKYLLRL